MLSSPTSPTPSGAARPGTASRESSGSRRSTSTRRRAPFSSSPGRASSAGTGTARSATSCSRRSCARTLADPPERARVVVARRCFPTGALGYWVRRLAAGGLVAALTATSPRRLAHPDGGPPLAGTNPLAIAIPSSDGPPVVADVSMGAVTAGDVLVGRATRETSSCRSAARTRTRRSRSPSGSSCSSTALAGPEHGAVLVVARPDHDPVPALRALAGGRRLPGDASSRS